ncbi:MAG: helix-turn-helix domain-containing protein [Acetatifactor sp.]
MSLYYENLPIVEDENWLFTILRTLGNHLWGGRDNFCMEYIDYMIPDRSEPIAVKSSEEQLLESTRTLETLEENYLHENQLMEAVSKGKLHLVTAVASTVFNRGTEPRITDTLRNRKNYLIILNTLLRKAAETGGVHPLHIDKISSDFARKIERVPSIHQSLSLQEKMIREYCLLVKKYSLKKYSYYVGRAITLVHYDLTADLSLKSVSEQLGVNPNYFATLFRKECGCTLTEYVNGQRIDRAYVLLKKTGKPVQEIASECGFSDANYFIRLFKRRTGLTPNQYRQQHR